MYLLNDKNQIINNETKNVVIRFKLITYNNNLKIKDHE